MTTGAYCRMCGSDSFGCTSCAFVRDRFLAILGSLPLLAGDAIVVLCGEDGEARAEVVPELLSRNAAQHVVLTGGKDEPPRWHGADRFYRKLIGRGVSPSAIIRDTAAQNTREQAVNVVKLALDKGWRRLLLVASPYHAPRAFLTFLHALIEAKQDHHIHLVNVPAIAMSWFRPPNGMTETRADLFADELRKIDEYASHVATYEQGLAYLTHWDGR